MTLQQDYHFRTIRHRPGSLSSNGGTLWLVAGWRYGPPLWRHSSHCWGVQADRPNAAVPGGQHAGVQVPWHQVGCPVNLSLTWFWLWPLVSDPVLVVTPGFWQGPGRNSWFLTQFWCVHREEHIQALLAVRGDASREMRQMIIGTLSENKVSSSAGMQPVFRDITVPTITMTTMTTMTSMATAKLLKWSRTSWNVFICDCVGLVCFHSDRKIIQEINFFSLKLLFWKNV